MSPGSTNSEVCVCCLILLVLFGALEKKGVGSELSTTSAPGVLPTALEDTQGSTSPRSALDTRDNCPSQPAPLLEGTSMIRTEKESQAFGEQ